MQVSAQSGNSNWSDYKTEVNYDDAEKYIKNENGVTEAVFLRYMRAEHGVGEGEAKKLFKAIDANNSGGLREAEFNRWSGGSSNRSGNDRSGNDRPDNDRPDNDRPDNDGGGSGGNIDGVRFENFTKLPREGTKTFNNVDAKYILVIESHGRNAKDTVNANDILKIDGAKLVGYGGSSDKYIALYEVTDDTVRTHSDGGSAQILFIDTDKKVSLSAEATDPSLGAEKVRGPSGNNEIVVYAEDEGGKGDRDAFFKPKAMDVFGSGDDLLYLFGKGLSSNNNGGPNGNGAVGTLKFS